MSNRSLISLGGLLCAGFVAVAGCSSGDADATAQVGKYNTSSLDAYMSDSTVAFKKPHNLTSSSKEPSKVSNSTWTDNFDYDQQPVDYKGFDGAWIGTVVMEDSGQSSGNPEMDQMGKAFADAFSEMLSMSLSLNKDHTFEMVMMIMPVEGEWELKGNSLFLTPTKVMGMTEDELKKMSEMAAEQMVDSFDSNGVDMTMESDSFEPWELRIAEKGKVMVAQDPTSEGSQPLVFRRK